ncbi:mechanosensitive ion channel protein 8-like protein [Corchorus capsularis]|uniref:Mechanosensitive ion channel protein 8-like protein n=1 Tax=Corchorus capsularis TaxID=210143 RepID=A0A1R3H5U3_COCAP|nr:mechanosensitive ion channel protein 8-like protein [Corchorus capsularis]
MEGIVIEEDQGDQGREQEQLLENDNQDAVIEGLMAEETKQGEMSKKIAMIHGSICWLLALSLPLSIWLPKWHTLSLCDLAIGKWHALILLIVFGKIAFRRILEQVALFMRKKLCNKRRWLYYFQETSAAIENCLWLISLYSLWNIVFDHRLRRGVSLKYFVFINKVLIGLVVSSILWVIKVNILKIVAFNYYSRLLSLRVRDMEFSATMISQMASEVDSFGSVRNEIDAKELARKIIQNLSNNSSRYIHLEDLLPFEC